MKIIKIVIAGIFISANSFCQLTSNALHFDGLNDVIIAGYIPAYDINDGDFTVEAWVRDEATPGGSSEEEIFSTEFYDFYTHARLRICIQWGQLTVYINGQGYGLSQTFDLRDNTCHHIAVTRSAGTILGYIDGSSQIGAYAPDSINSYQFWTELKIGGRGNVPGTYFNCFKGLIKEVRFWNTARTWSEINNNMNTVLAGSANPNLIGYWRFNEGPGQTTLYDYSNNFNTAVFVLDSYGPAWSTGCPNCIAPSATITPSGPTTFCSGGSVVLNAPVAANRTYQWKKGANLISGATLSSYTTTTGGNYRVIVTNTVTGCSKTTGSATVVTVNALPTATITPQGPTTFCVGGSVVLAANTGAGLSYKWKKGSNFIAGATLLNYTATIGGTYKVQVTNSNGCSKTSAGVVISVPCREGVPIAIGIDVRVYPNPSSGDFTFEMENTLKEKITIHLYNLMGKLVLSELIHNSTFIIHNSKLVPGVYSAIITIGNYSKAIKIIKTI
jgi:hypothetical protein